MTLQQRLQAIEASMTPLVWQWTGDRLVEKSSKSLERINKSLEELRHGMGDAEWAFVQKPVDQRDAYDIAFSKMNPDSESKQKKYQNLLNKKLGVENEMINIESARDIMNEIYSKQIGAVNDGAKSLSRGVSMSNDIARSSALAATGAMGANAVQASGLKAQMDNQNLAQQQQIEGQRQNALSNAYGNMAQMPGQLANIAASNAGVRQQDELLKIQRKQVATEGKRNRTTSKNKTTAKLGTNQDGGHYILIGGVPYNISDKEYLSLSKFDWDSLTKEYLKLRGGDNAFDMDPNKEKK